MERYKLQLQDDAETSLWSRVYVKVMECNARLSCAVLTSSSSSRPDPQWPYSAEDLADMAVEKLRVRLKKEG